MLLRLIASKWLQEENPGIRRVREGEFSEEQWTLYNQQGYNVYFLPNAPSTYAPGTTVEGSHIDTFSNIFVDFDVKSGTEKGLFLETLRSLAPPPTAVVDSGNGIHVYWSVSDLDAMSYLRLSRRMMRLLKTDEAVGQIYQLMRLPGSINVKDKAFPKSCNIIESTNSVYTCEELDSALPPITQADEQHCQQHYSRTYSIGNDDVKVNDIIPAKFSKLIRDSAEAKEIWSGNVEDRSKADFRLGHLMFAAGFTKEEAMSVLVNSPKALSRTPTHRIGYAENIVNKIWTFEEPSVSQDLDLSESVEDILSRNDDEELKGRRFPCHKFFDGTAHGFRLGQVVGLCAGVGVGKTTIALNLFKGFVEHNPDYVHMFVSLEQPGREIAGRWKAMCGEDTRLHKKVHILSNYNADGTYRNLSLHDIQDYVLSFQKRTGLKVGCVCIDHIGVLKKETRNGENQGLMEICQEMKSFAISTDTLLVMQSQTSREKAGIGDLELNKDCAYGTTAFESYLDYLIAAWQPLKRCYDNPACPPVTAYKFCKIRFKTKGKDSLMEDMSYRLIFIPASETFREFTQADEDGFKYFANQALALRKKDRQKDLVTYTSIKTKGHDVGKSDSNSDTSGAKLT